MQETSPTEGVIGVVACGDAVAIVPAAAQRLHIDGVTYRPLTPPRTATPESTIVEFAIAWLTDAVPPTGAAFVTATKALPLGRGGITRGRETRHIKEISQ